MNPLERDTKTPGQEIVPGADPCSPYRTDHPQ